MSDLHHLPLTGHDLIYRPAVRAKVWRGSSGFTGNPHWFWSYVDEHVNVLYHGPFASWREAYDSARRMVELL